MEKSLQNTLPTSAMNSKSSLLTGSRETFISGVAEMCKHILNVQVSIRAPCCKKWFDCSECHMDTEDHSLKKVDEMVFACKKCKKVFRKNMRDFDECDEFCPYCDNHYVLEAKTAAPVIGFEAEDIRLESRIIRDDREKQKTKMLGLP